MDTEWELIWELFHYAVLSAALAGVVCPLIGCFLLVRRTGFFGVALPQFAATGVALGWALPVWWMQAGWSTIDLEVVQLESPHLVKNYLLGLAALTTFGGLLTLQMVGRRKETETGRVAAAFAIASALTVLLAGVSPHGGEVIGQLLRGEVLTAGLHEFETIGLVYVVVLLCMLWFHKPLLLTSYDPDAARICGINVRRHEGLLLLLVGATVSVGVLIVGPIVLFGLLVIPPLAAQSLARSMREMFLLASTLGLCAAIGGVAISFEFDLPLGPSVVSAAGLELLPALAIARWRRP